MPSEPVQRVLSALEAHGLKVRREGSGYKCQCPAHPDNNLSLSVKEGEDGRALLHCFAGCEFGAIAAGLDLAAKDLFPDKGDGHRSRPAASTATARKSSARTTPTKPLSLADYAAHKALPEDFLRGLGLEDSPEGIRLPYRHSDGTVALYKLRTHAVAKEGSKWPANMPLMAYGQERLEPARQVRLLLAVEGESDWQTTALHGIPALGLPGAGATDTLKAEHLEGIERLYVWQEPDKGGEQFRSGIAKRLQVLQWLGRAYVLKPPAGTKDLNDLHRQHLGDADAFKAALKAIVDAAEPLNAAASLDTHRVNSLLPQAEAEMARNAARSPELPLGLTTGFAWLDKATEGFLPATFWVVGAFTSTGKTALALQMALRSLEAGARVAVFSLEMSSRANLYRLLANRSGVSAVAIRRGHLEDSDKARVDAASKWLDRLPLYLFDQLYSLDAISETARALKRGGGLDVLFLDYLQNLQGEGSLFERMSTAAPRLQGLAKELDCCIVALSQFSNEVARGEVGILAYKGAGEIAASADVGLRLERDKDDSARLHLYLTKNKEGPSGLKRTLRWDSAFTRLTAEATSTGGKGSCKGKAGSSSGARA
jgi:replicative DNA helicase